MKRLNSFRYFNVKDYGAKGDGSTNDTTAVQAAADAALAAGGGIVFAPAGNFMVNPIYFASGVSLEGAGSNVTIFTRISAATSNPSNSVGTLNWHGTSGERLQRFSIRGVTADGNRSGITLGTGALVDNEAFSLIYCNNFFIEDCRGNNAPGEGFDLDYCINGTLIGCSAYDNGGNGFHASLDSTQIKFIANYAYGNGLVYDRSGFDQYSTAANCVYIGNVSESNRYRNYNIDGTGAIVSGNNSLGTPIAEDVFAGAVGSSTVVSIKKAAASTKERVITMAGWTYVQGNAAQILNHTLALPETLSGNDELMSFTVSYLGGRQTSKGNPAGIGDFDEALNSNYGTIGASQHSVGSSNIIVTMARLTGSTWANTYNYGYSWIAVLKRKQ